MRREYCNMSSKQDTWSTKSNCCFWNNGRKLNEPQEKVVLPKVKSHASHEKIMHCVIIVCCLYSSLPCKIVGVLLPWTNSSFESKSFWLCS